MPETVAECLIDPLLIIHIAVGAVVSDVDNDKINANNDGLSLAERTGGLAKMGTHASSGRSKSHYPSLLHSPTPACPSATFTTATTTVL